MEIKKLDSLYDRLKEYSEEAIYPYHMPGHKRHAVTSLPKELVEIDITEIDEFDNLHQAEGILQELQKEAANLYGAEESFYLVNGSTGGVLSAVSAVFPEGGHILMARNCHKSVYHAAYLRKLSISYLYPTMVNGYDVFEAITPEQVRNELENNPEIQGVLIVSPTYEGRIADIEGIAEIVHSRNIPLIVDEAHGAHLGFHKAFAENSCRKGADIVIQSVHKTLPALTQTALLHVNGKLVNRGKIRRFLNIYQTSSPSYVLMASIDSALKYIKSDGMDAFKQFVQRWDKMYERLSGCKHLRFLPRDINKQDIGKLVIFVGNANLSGMELYYLLREKYKLQLEMASESSALAMFTVGDSEEGFERMTNALLEIDSELTDNNIVEVPAPIKVLEPKIKMPLSLAWDYDTEECNLNQSEGRISGTFINLYPPGIPILVPGENISNMIIRIINEYLAKGLNVQGIKNIDSNTKVSVLK